MRAQALPSSAGWRWLLGGLAIYRRNPPILSLLVVAYWFSIVILDSLPLAGPVLASLALPGLAVGLMQAARNVERGAGVSLSTLFGSFRDNPRTLLALGALYLCCSLGALAFSALLDGGDLMKYVLADSKAERAALEDNDFTLAILCVMVLLLPVMMANWFAPVLAAWHRLTLFKALFFSLVACAMNWRPFVTYGLALFVFAGVLPALFLSLLLLIFPAAAQFMVALVMTPMMLIVAPVVFASFYACYHDIFGISEIV